MATINGTNGNDYIHRNGDGRTVPAGFNEITGVTNGDDVITGGGGDDIIFGEGGNDTANIDATTGLLGGGSGADRINLGSGVDVVAVSADSPVNVRLTFTSAEVGNGDANDSGTLANQDGGLAVRLQGEFLGTPTGNVSRIDDESITFIGGAGVTFDVRDLVSGAARGENFEVVALGGMFGERMSAVQAARPYYINGGGGDDVISGGTANDFLVGGAGNDKLVGGDGDDSFIGGGGDDVIRGGSGNDTYNYNVSTDLCDRVNLDDGADVVNVTAAAAGQVRLTFTSAEVGNANPLDSGTLANQDGLYAVRMRAEDASGNLTGNLSRYDDEGITFVAGAGITFDVRDLVSGIARGDQFEVVTLGTSAGDRLLAMQAARPYYINGGGGEDVISGGTANDFLVGGAGNDKLVGEGGNDSFIGGGGIDVVRGGEGNDTAIFNISTDGGDRINLDGGSDTVRVSAANPGQVRLTFTSAEVGNGSTVDSGSMANQDGGFAVRMQLENGSGAPAGSIARVDDEGITFEAVGGITFDVRDLVSGTARGDTFEVVTLGTNAGETLTAADLRDTYINAGQGDDTLLGGDANDFLVGGAGADTIDGGGSDDSFIGGGGADTFRFSTTLGAGNVDSIIDFSVADDTIALDNAVFAGLTEGALAPEAFADGSEAPAADDRIIYDVDTGRLFFDADGTGGAFGGVLFARVTPFTALTSADFVVV